VSALRKLIVQLFLAITPIASAQANAVTDWDEIAMAVIQGNAPAPPPEIGPAGGERIATIMHLAVFGAVNTIDPRYKPYLDQTLPKVDASQEAAATAAAATVLVRMLPEKAAHIMHERGIHLARIADGEAKDRAIRLGEEMALKVIKSRLMDGYGAPNEFRPMTQPGVYTETMLTYGWDISTMRPFVLTSASQFRPPPPISLTSEEWTKNYNEMKEYGEKDSPIRTPRQTEDAKFWLTVSPGSNQPLARQIVIRKGMSIVDSARFMALVTMAQMDAAIAVFDAKYHYTFWRPITAIRNGDIDGNPATDRVATWQPIGPTPLHPEYPCAHCIITGAMAGAIAAILGTDEIPRSELTSPTATGVIHSYTNLHGFNDEVSEARIWAGFHWRFSTEVGKDMGWKIGTYAVQTCMQPLNMAGR
jgi:hypothetical protein